MKPSILLRRRPLIGPIFGVAFILGIVCCFICCSLWIGFGDPARITDSVDLATLRAPLVLIGGRATPLPAGDGLDLATGSLNAASVTVNSVPVPTTARTLTAGTGLSGGGDLSVNRSFALANTAVTAGSYTLASVTVDAQGRLTAASSGAAALTNGAGANVIPKSDGTNLVASSITDNGTTINLGDSTTFSNSIGLTSTQNFATTGTTNSVTLNATTNILRYTGAGTATWNGISGGFAGRYLCVQNTTASGIALGHLNGAGTAGQRFVLTSARDGSIKNVNMLCFIYDTALDGGSGAWQQEQNSYISVLSGERINMVGTLSTSNMIAGTLTTVGSTTSNVGILTGINNGSYDTTAGALNAYVVNGTASASRSAGANNLLNIGAGMGVTGSAQDNRGFWANVTSTGTINYGFRGDVSGAGTTNIAGLFTATNATTNTALQTDAGNVLLNGTSGDTKIAGRIIRTAAPSVSHGTLGTGSTDWIGNVTGVGAFTSVVLTFSGTGFGSRSWCTANQNTTTLPEIITVTNSATAPTFSCANSTTGVAANCNDFTWSCVGQ